MATEQKIVYGKHDAGQGTLKAYVIGFISSVILTLTAFMAVDLHIHAQHSTFSTTALVAFIISLAIVQLGVQLVCFLHIGREAKPRWKLTALLFALVVVLIVVLGSLWIMSSLNYRMTASPSQINKYLQSQDGL